jgi:hypothetical protein
VGATRQPHPDQPPRRSTSFFKLTVGRFFKLPLIGFLYRLIGSFLKLQVAMCSQPRVSTELLRRRSHRSVSTHIFSCFKLPVSNFFKRPVASFLKHLVGSFLKLPVATCISHDGLMEEEETNAVASVLCGGSGSSLKPPHPRYGLDNSLIRVAVFSGSIGDLRPPSPARHRRKAH